MDSFILMWVKNSWVPNDEDKHVVIVVAGDGEIVTEDCIPFDDDNDTNEIDRDLITQEATRISEEHYDPEDTREFDDDGGDDVPDYWQ